MSKHLTVIDNGLKRGEEYSKIIRKVYFTYPTQVFLNNEDIMCDLFDKISEFFKVPYTSIYIAGSGKIGFSMYKNKKFNKKTSDLDVAIIDKDLFLKYAEIIHKATKGFNDLQKFKDLEYVEIFKYSLLSGMIQLNFMPDIKEKFMTIAFLNKLSAEYIAYCKDITVRLYVSQFYFEDKQRILLKKRKRILEDKK